MDTTYRPIPQTVVIYAKCCEARVVPGRVVASPGDTISFEVVNTEAILFFPQGLLEINGFPQDEASMRSCIEKVKGFSPCAAIRLPFEGTHWIRARVREDAAPDVYPYAVFCPQEKKFAIGASDPEIIIRRG